jgi:hypothetical protein
VIGVEQWAEIRRLSFVEKRSKRAIRRLTGAHRDTITRAIASDTPPRDARKATGSKLDLLKGWICEQLQADPTIQAQRLREMATELGYEGGKTIFDELTAVTTGLIFDLITRRTSRLARRSSSSCRTNS